MIVGIVIIFAGILFAFASDIFDIQTTADSISMQKVTIQKAGSEAYVSAVVKNTGNRAITDLDVNIMLDTDSSATGLQPFKLELEPSPLDPGVTATKYNKLVDSTGADIAVAHGQEISVVIEATTTDGSNLSESFTVRAQ